MLLPFLVVLFMIFCFVRNIKSGVFERAGNYFRTSAPELKEERAMLLEEWLEVEKSFGEMGDPDSVRAKLPKKLNRRRQIETEDGPAGYAHRLNGFLSFTWVVVTLEWIKTYKKKKGKW